MSSFWNFLFGAILVIVWIISGGFVTQANVFLTSYKDKDSDLSRAYWYSFSAAFITWFLIGVFIILIILSVIGLVALFGSGVGEAGAAAEEAETARVAAEAEFTLSRKGIRNYATSPQGQSTITTGISWFTIGFLVFALLLVVTTGILSALAASSMTQSHNFDPSDSKLKTAYNDCIIAASLSLGAAGLLIIGIIVYFVVGLERQRKIDAQKKLEQKREQLELAEIRRVKQEALRQKIQQEAVFKQELQQTEEQALLQKVYERVAGSHK